MHCETCALEQRVRQLEEEAKKNSEHHGEFYKRIREIEQFQTRIDANYLNIMKEIERMSTILEELRNKPAKNWNTVVSALITGIVGIVVGFIMNGGM